MDTRFTAKEPSMNLTNREERWYLIMLSLSMLGASLIGGRVYQTLCSLAWERRYDSGLSGAYSRLTIKVMDYIERDHCKISHHFWLKTLRK